MVRGKTPVASALFLWGDWGPGNQIAVVDLVLKYITILVKVKMLTVMKKGKLMTMLISWGFPGGSVI